MKLKTKLEKDEELGEEISFSKVTLSERGCFSFWLIYSSNISLEDAMSCAYRLGTDDHIRDTTLSLREVILKAFAEFLDLPWPPTADELDKHAHEELPKELQRFLTLPFGGCASQKNCEKTHCLVYSIGQDLCRAVTTGQWKLSKNMLLCTTVHHLYHSKQLPTILNRLGHCEFYNFGLELETAICKALDEESAYPTPKIICGENNKVFHSEWDNLNKITTNIHGSNVVNSAGGIMIQETASDALPCTERTISLYERNKTRSLKTDTPETLPPVTIYNRESPKFPQNASFVPPDDDVLASSLKEYYVWLLCRCVLIIA